VANSFFGILTWTGTGAAISVTGLGFQPDVVFIKQYDGVGDWAAYDSGRGVQKKWALNTANAQTTDANGLTAFGADGITVGTSHSAGSANYIAFCWRKGTSQFDLQNFTGNGTNGRLVGHSLGVAPGLIFDKDVAGAFDTPTNSNGAAWAGTSCKFLSSSALNPGTYASPGTASSTQFEVADTAYDNNTGAATCLAYLFASMAGSSAVGTYVGNGNASGPSVSLGFTPQFLMITLAGTGDWNIVNSVRSPSNTVQTSLALNSTRAENATDVAVDLNPSSFQIKSSTLLNTSSSTYLYAAYGSQTVSNPPYQPWAQLGPLLAQFEAIGRSFSGWRKRRSGLLTPGWSM